TRPSAAPARAGARLAPLTPRPARASGRSARAEAWRPARKAVRAARKAARPARARDRRTGRGSGRPPTGPQPRPAADVADCTVLERSIVIVIGPTPPGTGEIAAATSRTSSKRTSPQTR